MHCKITTIVFVFIVLINVLIPNLGDVMHFNLNIIYFKFIFYELHTIAGQSSAGEKDSAAQRADVSPGKGWKAH